MADIQTGYWYIPSHDFDAFKGRYPNFEDLVIHGGSSFDEDMKKASWSEFKEYGEDNHIPMLVFWGSCPKCMSFRSKALSDANFKNFAVSSQG